MAERTKLSAYLFFSLLNTIVYCFPVHWVWSSNGWLNKMGMIDVAGAGPVHLVGGVTGLMATIVLGPRYNRWDESNRLKMASPTNILLGTFMLWWGWLGFNCGSTFGISGYKWVLAARSAVATLVASVSGGATGFILSFFVNNRRYDVEYIVNSLLGSLVGITAFCALASPWESFVIGAIGAVVSLGGVFLLKRFKIDDPVGVVGVHGLGAVWSLIAVGLFTKQGVYKRALQINDNHIGLFYGGGFYLLGVQVLGCTAIVTWTAIVSFILLKLVDLTFGLRVSLDDEILGADLVEHGVNSGELPGDEEEQREYVRFMMQESTRGEGDGSFDSYTHSNDMTTVGDMVPDDGHSTMNIDPEIFYKQLGLLETRKKTHVFGSRVHKVQNMPFVLGYLRRLNRRRFSDEVVSTKQGDNSGKHFLRRASSLKDVSVRENGGPLTYPATFHSSPLHLHPSLRYNSHPISSISETVDHEDSSLSKRSTLYHQHQNFGYTNSDCENMETDIATKL